MPTPTPTPWTAERLVSPSQARALIREQHPSLAVDHIERLGEGWDNVAYLVDEAWVFRFPRRTIGAELLEYELRVLPAIASRLPLPIPMPQWRGEPTEAFPWPFAGYRVLPGRTACRADLDHAQRMALAEPLGEFLAVLHAIDPHQVHAPPDDLARTDTRRRVPMVLESLQSSRAAGLLDDLRPYERVLEQAHDELPSRITLVHADLYVRHVLVDEAGRASGVIDWGDVHAGHPGLDFALAFSLLPARARDRFARAYGTIDDECWRLARQRGLLYGAVMLAYGHDIGDEALVREGRFALAGALV